VASSLCLQDQQEEKLTDRPMLLTFENLSRILQLEPACQPQNLPAEPQKLERVTPRSTFNNASNLLRGVSSARIEQSATV